MSSRESGVFIPGVFSKFTFFSILTPGLLCTLLLTPIVPYRIIEEEIGFEFPIVILIFAFSFVSGMTFYIFGEVLEDRLKDTWVFRLTTPIQELQEIQSLISTIKTEQVIEEDSPDPIEIIRSSQEDSVSVNTTLILKLYESNLLEDEFHDDPKFGYKYLLNAYWGERSALPNTLITLYYLCRTVLLIVLIFTVIYLLVPIIWHLCSIPLVNPDNGTMVGQWQMELRKISNCSNYPPFGYEPLYQGLEVGSALFLLTIYISLSMLGGFFYYGYKNFTTYVIEYQIINILDQQDR